MIWSIDIVCLLNFLSLVVVFGCIVITVLSDNFVESIVECWWSVFGFTIKIDINAKAGDKSKNGFIKEAEENAGANVGNGSNDEGWYHPAISSYLFEISSNRHKPIEEHQVDNYDSELTKKDETLGEEVSEGKFHGVLHVEEETVPSRFTEAISRYGHVRVCWFVDVIADFLETCDAASGDSDNNFDDGVFSWGLSCILGNDQEANLDELNDRNNERSKGEGANMELVAELECNVNISLSGLLSIRVKIVSGSWYHSDELSLCLKELADPQNTKEHVKVHVEDLILELFVLCDFLILWNFTAWVSHELSHRVDTGHAE